MELDKRGKKLASVVQSFPAQYAERIPYSDPFIGRVEYECAGCGKIGSNEDDESEIIVPLLDGCTVRSSSETRVSGDYVRVCDPYGEELDYWDWAEWERNPILVMGSIINTMAGHSADLGRSHPLVEPVVEENKPERLAYIATIQVLLDLESPSEAADTLSESLRIGRDSTEAQKHLIDWSYLRFAGVWTQPTSRVVPKDYRWSSGHMNTSFNALDLVADGNAWRVSAATLQLCIESDAGQAQARDTVEDLMNEIPEMVDWQFMRLGAQHLPIQEVMIPAGEDYREGDAFEAAEETQLTLFQT